METKVGSLTGYGSSGKKGVVKPHLCSECGETDPSNFYGKQKIRCKKCHSKGTHQALTEARARAIEYKGGECKHCGYKKYQGALQFHHMDPKEKDPKLFKRLKNFKKIKVELDKCILLCANCHAEEHERIRKVG